MTRRPSLALVTALLVLAGAAVAAARPIDGLMIDLNIAPMEPRTPPPLVVTTLDGARVTLADVRGKAALVYFWATW